MTTRKMLDGKPYVENPYVRFDDGEVASSATTRRGSLLYKKLLMVIGVAAACCCEARADYMLKATLSGIDFNWASDDSYEGGAAPSSAGAYVCIPNGMVAKLSAADETSWTFVTGKVARIRPMGMTSKLVVYVATANSPATLMSEVTYTAENVASNYDRGGMEKTGDGELKLGASGSKYSYFTTITVSEGTLSLLDGDTADKYYVDTVYVATNATLNLIGTTTSAKSITVCRKFFGEGTINCRNGAFQTYDNSLRSEFAGRFTGTSSRMLTACSPIVLSGTPTITHALRQSISRNILNISD